MRFTALPPALEPDGGDGVPPEAPELATLHPLISAIARSSICRLYDLSEMWSHASRFVELYASMTNPSAIFSIKSR